MNGTMYILRGVPGCGKSTLAEILSKALSYNGHEVPICCADDFFMKDGEYKWNPKQIGFAHKWCQSNARMAMENKNIDNVIVANTTTTEKEVKTYTDMAAEYNYRVVSLIVENRHDGKNIHGVPNEVLDAMANRFSVKLK